MYRSIEKTSGRINPLLMTLLIGGVAVIGLVFLLPSGGVKQSSEREPLRMLVAAGLRVPVEEVLEEFQEELDTQVIVQYGGSNMLLGQLKVNKFEQPDLYLAADEFYIQNAYAEGLTEEVFPIASQEPVLAMRKDRAADFATWQQLLELGLRWSIPDPEQAANGRAVQEILSQISWQSGSLWDQVHQQTLDRGVFKPTVNETNNDIKIGAVDIGFVWSSTVAAPENRDELVAVRLKSLAETAELADFAEQITLAVLTTSSQPTAALRLARYMTAADRGLPKFSAVGMSVIAGDSWAETPELTFYCGAVNRRAVEPVIDRFQRREGVIVNTVFDGCGILTGRMGAIAGQAQAAGFPDVYMACDRYYLENVQDWFQEDVNVSQTEIVLVVPKGTTQVKELPDLLKPGVRVSVGEPDQCTIGALTRRLLQQAGLYDQFKEKQGRADEVIVEKSSSALIVPDVLTGAVDVAVAYRNDVLQHQDDVDVISIPSPLTKAIQPLSIAKGSEFKNLSRRLYRQIEKAQESFESAGFEFLLPAAGPKR